MGGTVGAQGAEGDGVGAALAGEVAAEPEHMSPGGQAQVCQFGELAESEAFGDETAGVVAERQCGELVDGGETAVEGDRLTNSPRRARMRASSRAALAASSVSKPPTHLGLVTPVAGSGTRST